MSRVAKTLGLQNVLKIFHGHIHGVQEQPEILNRVFESECV